MSESFIDPALRPIRDRPTVTPSGERLERGIDGVVLHRLPQIEDERGSVTELYRPEWRLHVEPLVYAYEVITRPTIVKGWVVHKKQDDRIFLSRGTLWWAFYDGRPQSPTFKRVHDFVVTGESRSLLIIPAGVFHAVKNIGLADAVFVNMPTRGYDHEAPDKYRLPIDGQTIPFTFEAHRA